MKAKTTQSLVTIRLSEVPLYLQSSKLFLSFSDDHQDEICIPSNCLKRATSVNSRSDLEQMLSTIRFWMLDCSFPSDLVAYVTDFQNPGVKELVPLYRDAFPSLHNLVNDLPRYPCKHFCNIAAKHGCVDFLEYFAEQNKPLSMATLQIAAEGGNAECVSYCCRCLKRTNFEKRLDIANWDKVIKLGFVDCLKILVQHGWSPDKNTCSACLLACLQYLMSVCPDQSSAVTTAAATGDHLHCLKYLIEQGCEVTYQTWKASMTPFFPVANEGDPGVKPYNPHCLLYLLDEVQVPEGNATLVHAAISSNNEIALHFLHQRGFSVVPELVDYAARAGSFGCLQYLKQEHNFDCWVPATMAAAASAGRLELVTQLHELGCRWDESAPTAALLSDEAECLRYLFAQRGIPTGATFLAVQLGDRCSWVVDWFVFLRKLNPACMYYYRNEKTTNNPSFTAGTCRCIKCNPKAFIAKYLQRR